MKPGRAPRVGDWLWTRRERCRRLPAVLLLPLLCGCTAGVNDELTATVTPYPVRSPAAAATPPIAEPSPSVGLAIAAAEAAALRGDLAAADAAFDLAVKADSSNLDALLGRAVVRAKRGDSLGARSDADAAVALAPDRPVSFLARADVARRRADFAAAREDYGTAIALDPANAAAFVGRGEVENWLAQGAHDRYRNALEDFTRALALDPESLPARLGRARVFLDRAAFGGDPVDLDRATTELDAVPVGVAGEAVGLLRARLLAARGDLEEARRLLDAPVVRRLDASRASPEERLIARAVVAAAAREWDAAAATAAAALAANPSAWECHRLLADAELRRGDALAALAAADAILDRWTDDGPSLYLRGMALLALGRTEDARVALATARERLVASPVYQARIAQALSSV